MVQLSFLSRRTSRLWLMVAWSLVWLNILSARQGLVEFRFSVVPSELGAFERNISAEIALPSGRVINYPAFYAGGRLYAVRVRADSLGEYRLGPVTELIGERIVSLKTNSEGPSKVVVSVLNNRPSVMIDPADRRNLVLSSGERFVPLGANLAWPDGRASKYYQKAFGVFARNGLNWTRVWMSHWGGLNLNWLPGRQGSFLRGSELDLRVAEAWDKILEAAEDNGVYIQVVLQHHGQYSSEVNSNWKDNPWNLANGGFLVFPVDFFTSPEALRLTLLKYRYIVARWGYSPAVMSWELFNEVHWTDAMRGKNKNEEAVAQWHAKAAGFLRSIDRWNHLITTSTEDLHSPIYAEMDYLQPHLYAPNLLAGVRKYETSPEALNKPVFYGEMGDDHLAVAQEVKASGVTVVPPVWAGLTGEGRFPVQAWLGRELLQKGRISELGAVARFVSANAFFQKQSLIPCSFAVECSERIPFVLEGGYLWHPRPAIDIELPLDGREPLAFADIPRIYMNASESAKNGQSSRATFHVNLPRPLTFRFKIIDSAAAASGFRFWVDDTVTAETVWPELPKDASVKGPRPQADIVVSVPSGRHTLVIENPTDTGWFDLAGVDLGLERPVLSAVGKRSDRFLFLWVWNRQGVFSTKPVPAVSGSIQIDDLPAGRWRMTWWNTFTGLPEGTTVIEHPGGSHRLVVPPVNSHKAVTFEKLE